MNRFLVHKPQAMAMLEFIRSRDKACSSEIREALGLSLREYRSGIRILSDSGLIVKCGFVPGKNSSYWRAV